MKEKAAENSAAPPSIEALEAAHSFPTTYTMKLIGPDTPAFIAGARQVCLAHGCAVEVGERRSKSGQHLALSLRIEVASAKVIQLIYTELTTLAGLKFIL